MSSFKSSFYKVFCIPAHERYSDTLSLEQCWSESVVSVERVVGVMGGQLSIAINSCPWRKSCRQWSSLGRMISLSIRQSITVWKHLITLLTVSRKGSCGGVDVAVGGVHETVSGR